MSLSKLIIIPVFALLLAVGALKVQADKVPSMGRRPVAAGRSVSTKPSAIKLKARITKYNDCQQPMANGKMPQPGYVAVSDRRIKLGSLIWIGYQRYIVGDYTSKWVHKKSVREGYDLTVDIFTREKRQDCLEFGVKKEHIALQKA